MRTPATTRLPSCLPSRLVAPCSFLLTCSFLLMLGVWASGCASSSAASGGGGGGSFERVTPASYQPGPVQLTTQEGYEILGSEKAGSRVAVSLRAARSGYLQFYVTVLNKGSEPRQISPADVRLRFTGGDGRTVSAYAPSSLPDLLAADAAGDVATAAQLMEATGALYADERGRSGTEGNPAYGGGASDDGGSGGASNALLQSTYIVGGRRAGGFVYTPVPEGVGAGQFVIEVPVGEEVHKFRYTFE